MDGEFLRRFLLSHYQNHFHLSRRQNHWLVVAQAPPEL
jgi:hypothetical protein